MRSLSKLSKFILLNVWVVIIEIILYVITAFAAAGINASQPTNPLSIFSGAVGITMIILMLSVLVAWLVLSIKIWSNPNTPDVTTKSA